MTCRERNGAHTPRYFRIMLAVESKPWYERPDHHEPKAETLVTARPHSIFIDLDT